MIAKVRQTDLCTLLGRPISILTSFWSYNCTNEKNIVLDNNDNNVKYIFFFFIIIVLDNNDNNVK